MPIQAPQWTDYLNCPVCCREFGSPPRSPISLNCGHTICKHCLTHLNLKQCPFDQVTLNINLGNVAVNTTLLLLAGLKPPTQPHHPPSIKALPEEDRQTYDSCIKCLEELGAYLKCSGNGAGVKLSRPMQRKLVTLIQCAITDDESRGRAIRAVRSMGERTVTELILQHQNPQQLSANLWAAVRSRGCQFLGPAMQEEVLKLVLLVLEDGWSLSRKNLVMYVVQKLEPHFPQASKTSIGHVVQLLYRASCFKVSKRECDSSLMQLKEEFRTYEALRREHDVQIVQIATEAGLRIAPDQWSALLYGDAAHKSHMQSIIDKLQSPQSFAQSVQELMFALHRSGDPARLAALSPHLDRLASIDPNPEAPSPSWQWFAATLHSLKAVVAGLVHFTSHSHSAPSQLAPSQPPPNQVAPSQLAPSQAAPSQPAPLPTAPSPPSELADTENVGAAAGCHSAKYKVSMCWDAAKGSYCPRGDSCTFAHSKEELERYRMKNRRTSHRSPNELQMREEYSKHNDNVPTTQHIHNGNEILQPPPQIISTALDNRSMIRIPATVYPFPVMSQPMKPPTQMYPEVAASYQAMQNVQNFNNIPMVSGGGLHPAQQALLEGSYLYVPDVPVMMVPDVAHNGSVMLQPAMPLDNGTQMAIERGLIPMEMQPQLTMEMSPNAQTDRGQYPLERLMPRHNMHEIPNGLDMNLVPQVIDRGQTAPLERQMEFAQANIGNLFHNRGEMMVRRIDNNVVNTQVPNYPIVPKAHQREMFVRSDSILKEDEYVPYEAPPPPPGKYGPIARYQPAPHPHPHWQHHQVYQYQEMGPNMPVMDDRILEPNTNTVQPDIINSEACPGQAAMPRRQHYNQEKEEEYEDGIAKDMRELELKWEYELQQAEKRWSREDNTQA